MSQEQYDKLREGVEAWNIWARDNDEIIDLRQADLQGANLREADLRGADLQGANLQEADLRDIRINYLTMGIHPAPQGTLIVYKKCLRERGVSTIVTLRIDKNVPRSCSTTRKFRSQRAYVLRAERGSYTEGYGPRTEYVQGTSVKADTWDATRWNECSHGIHWFLTREEAEAW